jgi:hypothetical protein
MSKGMKGEKGLKKINKDKFVEEEKRNYEDALELNLYVKCKFMGNLEIAKIIDCRILKEEENKKKKTESSYEYYVHFIDFNRRNDKWVGRNEIIMDKEAIDIELKNRELKEKEMQRDNPFDNDEHEGLDANCLKTHEEATKIKTIDEIEMGKFRCETWYFSPYPEGYHVKLLYICEFCFNFYVDQIEMSKHSQVCVLKHPPGDEIYRDEKISMFEVDGRKEPIYCENLCYMAKLFLDHKTLQWDVEPFLFYIICEYDIYGYHFVGYFSKEKESSQGYNVACILTMPFHQRKGYGKFLIDFSYLLSRKEQKIATPERPLSDLGFVSYFSYWTQKLVEILRDFSDSNISINKLAELTSIKHSDISMVLEGLNIIRYYQGQHIVVADKVILDELYKKAGRPGHPLDPDKLIWTPFKLKYDI